jgi:prepilin-type N-terminal cleavage/methylation domain-containing protein
MPTCARFTGVLSPIRPIFRDERGFTLLEVMIAIVLITVGLLAAAGSFPQLTAASLYGKDQTRSANLAQQKMEVYRNTSCSSLNAFVGDYGTVASQYFDQNGTSTTAAAAYFTRDVQIQYWTWSASTSAFVQPANPYLAPSGTCTSSASPSYVYHISVATHWLVRGQTTFTSGNGNSPNGCVKSGAAVSVGRGCVTVSSFVAP